MMHLRPKSHDMHEDPSGSRSLSTATALPFSLFLYRALYGGVHTRRLDALRGQWPRSAF